MEALDGPGGGGGERDYNGSITHLCKVGDPNGGNVAIDGGVLVTFSVLGVGNHCNPPTDNLE